MIFKVLSQISITLCLCTWIHSNEGQVSVHDNIVQATMCSSLPCLSLFKFFR